MLRSQQVIENKRQASKKEPEKIPPKPQKYAQMPQKQPASPPLTPVESEISHFTFSGAYDKLSSIRGTGLVPPATREAP
jgi:hypothetical protein